MVKERKGRGESSFWYYSKKFEWTLLFWLLVCQKCSITLYCVFKCIIHDKPHAPLMFPGNYCFHCRMTCGEVSSSHQTLDPWSKLRNCTISQKTNSEEYYYWGFKFQMEITLEMYFNICSSSKFKIYIFFFLHTFQWIFHCLVSLMPMGMS